MSRPLAVLAGIVLSSAVSAMELRVGLSSPIIVSPAVTCWTVVVAPDAVDPTLCIFAAIPPNAAQMIWTATEGWEQPMLSPVTVGHTRLTCGAVWDQEHSGWSYSCFNAGVLGPAGLFTGPAPELAVLVKSWWMGQR